MFCPSCGDEFRAGFERCADCDVALVEHPPAPVSHEAEDADPVVVFSDSEPGALALAESVLLEAGLRFEVRGEGLQDLFGMGRVGGFNPIVGPARILVAAGDAEAARLVLAAVDYDAGADPETELPG